MIGLIPAAKKFTEKPGGWRRRSSSTDTTSIRDGLHDRWAPMKPPNPFFPPTAKGWPSRSTSFRSLSRHRSRSRRTFVCVVTAVSWFIDHDSWDILTRLTLQMPRSNSWLESAVVQSSFVTPIEYTTSAQTVTARALITFETCAFLYYNHRPQCSFWRKIQDLALNCIFVVFFSKKMSRGNQS